MNVDCKIKKVVLELSSCCNLKCKHCIYKISNNIRFFGFLPKEEAFRLIDKFTSDGTAPKFKTRCLHDIMDAKGEKSYAQRTPVSQQGC